MHELARSNGEDELRTTEMGSENPYYEYYEARDPRNCAGSCRCGGGKLHQELRQSWLTGMLYVQNTVYMQDAHGTLPLKPQVLPRQRAEPLSSHGGTSGRESHRSLLPCLPDRGAARMEARTAQQPAASARTHELCSQCACACALVVCLRAYARARSLVHCGPSLKTPRPTAPTLLLAPGRTVRLQSAKDTATLQE